jgi:carbon-monoxide dehydrogenase large subunit
MERLLDRVARELKLDHAEVRVRNLIKPEQIPYSKPYKTRGGVPIIIDSGDYPQCQAKALAAAGWDDFPKRQAEAREQGRLLGIGVANFVELTGRGPFEPATVKINTSGKIYVSSSAATMGQSTKTMLAQVVAEQLGGDMSNIVVTTGDTATSATGFGGFGSRQTVMAGSSAHAAAVKIREKMLAMAGQLLEISAQDLEIVGSEIRLKGAGDLKVTFAEVVKASMGIAGFYLPGGLPPGMEATEQVIINDMTYSNGTEVAIVEVDPDIGAVTILYIVFAHDCGKAINPMIVEGQVLGGIVHGIGNSLFEMMLSNDDGQPLTTTLAEYLLPTSTEIPRMRVVHHESLTPLNPLGAKGVGEAGVLPTAAVVVSAIENALEQYDVTIRHAPAAPPDIVMVIKDAQKAAAAV